MFENKEFINQDKIFTLMKRGVLLSALLKKKLQGKKVLLRIDANVPIQHKKILNDYRLQQILPTIHYLLESDIKQLIIISHLGRPKGKKKLRLSLNPIFLFFQKHIRIINQDIKFVKTLPKQLPDNKIILLENLRFHPGEEKNKKQFAKQLASYADIFVQDAFGTLHRNHASVTGIPLYVPSYLGLLVENEIKHLTYLKKNPKKPFVCLIGGGKPETKIPVIEQLIKKAKTVIVAGENCYPFYVSNGLLEKNQCHITVSSAIQKKVDELWEKYKKKIVLPLDGVILDKNKEKGNATTITTADFMNKKKIYFHDIGKKTIDLFSLHLHNAATIFWNGPLGFIEEKKYRKGTYAIAACIAENGNGYIGGGETQEMVHNLHLEHDMHFISTGGGAALHFVADKTLPGLQAITSTFKSK